MHTLIKFTQLPYFTDGEASSEVRNLSSIIPLVSSTTPSLHTEGVTVELGCVSLNRLQWCSSCAMLNIMGLCFYLVIDICNQNNNFGIYRAYLDTDMVIPNVK